MKRFWILIVALIVLGGTNPALAETSQDEKIKELEKQIQQLETQIQSISQQATAEQIEELKRQLKILAEELEKLRSGEEDIEVSDRARMALGLGPSAAHVYSKKQGVSLAGYGEMLYQNFGDETQSGSPSGKVDELDFLRAVLYFGYRFNDRFLFNSEIEVEHATTGDGIGEVSVEFAYIDFMANENITVRGGLVLLPMGFINEFHEPNVFLGARRPVTETVIIPTTWRENGFGFAGRNGIIDYRAYVINGLNSSGFTAAGLRGGRQDGAKAKIESPSVVGRVDLFPAAGLLLGGSFFGGDSGFFSNPNLNLEVPTYISEIHAQYNNLGLQLRGLYAFASLDNVVQLNEALGLVGAASVGESMAGGYLQAGYNILSGRTKGEMELIPYFRYEAVNTQKEVPQGYLSNPANDQTLWTMGAEFLPIPNLVIKADYQITENKADSGINQFNIDLGYSF